LESKLVAHVALHVTVKFSGPGLNNFKI